MVSSTAKTTKPQILGHAHVIPCQFSCKQTRWPCQLWRRGPVLDIHESDTYYTSSCVSDGDQGSCYARKNYRAQKVREVEAHKTTLRSGIPVSRRNGHGLGERIARVSCTRNLASHTRRFSPALPFVGQFEALWKHICQLWAQYLLMLGKRSGHTNEVYHWRVMDVDAQDRRPFSLTQNLGCPS